MQDGINDTDHRAYDDFLVRTRFSLSMNQISAAFYVEENGSYTQFLNTTPQVYIILRNLQTGENEFWHADVSVLDEEVLEALAEDAKSEDLDTYVGVEMKDVYVKGQNFLIGEYALNMVNYDADRKENEVLIGTYEGVSKAPDGYSHIIIDDINWKSVFNPIVVGTADLDSMQYLSEESDRIMQSENISYTVDYESISQRIYTSKESVKYVVPTGKPTGTGADYELIEGVFIAVLQIDLWEEHRFLLFTVYAISAGVVALLSASIVFNYYKIICEKVKREQYRKDMTNALAHDLKSPLMAISGYAENLIGHVHEEKRDYYATTILDTVHYMYSIIDNILELVKLEDTVIKLDKKTTDLSALTKELMS